MDLAGDLEIFFNSNDFADSAIYEPSAGSQIIFNGILFDEFEAINGEVSIGTGGSQPEFHCKTAIAPDAKRGEFLFIQSKTYKIQDVRPDGTGITVFILEKQN